MPDWLRDIFIAISAFVGGRVVNSVGERMRESRDLARGVDRLTTAVEGIGTDLKEIRGEIHTQVAGLKVEIHDQVSGLRTEIHYHKAQQDSRFNALEDRVDAVSSRIDNLHANIVKAPPAPIQRQRLRINQEMGCYEPADKDSNG